MMRIKDVRDGTITVEVQDMLIEQDYTIVGPELARLCAVSGGELKVLVELNDFRGWDPPELSLRPRFEGKPLGNSGRVAVVGVDPGSGRKLALPLFAGELRTFPPQARRDAEAWLSGGG